MPPRNSLPAKKVNPLDNPEQSNADIAKLLQEDFPEIDEPSADMVELPGGLIEGDDVVREATVRELTGEHEEALARAIASLNPFHYIDTLLVCGTAAIGDESHEAKVKLLLKKLLVGDRDALILGIRSATYGDAIDIPEWQCPECGASSDLSIKLSQIETKTIEDPKAEMFFEVPLRKGGSAKVRLANGADQVAVFENLKWTQAERDSRLLSRCVLEIHKDNTARSVQLEPSLVRNMSIPDRRSIIKELSERQPGPRYNDIKFTHDACGNEVSLQLSVGDLFPT
jgi:hypothetical protein